MTTAQRDDLPNDVLALLSSLDEQKRAGSEALIAVMSAATDLPPTLWTGRIVGFGSCRYRYDSGHQGETCALGFSPRAKEFALYLGLHLLDADARAAALQPLGTVREGKGCLYLKDPATVDPAALAHLLTASLQALAASPTTTDLTLGPGAQVEATAKA
ncbi:MAG TPA: hypothetical protein VNP95_09630 [Thermomicrobiales bacterium]|nr:hypothetical protein [Thermomicrobiales bacterium]